MTFSRYFLTGLILFFLMLPCSIFSQTENGETPEAAEEAPYQSSPEMEALLDAALSAAESGNWEKALSLLDEAEELDSLDPRVYSYRSSIEELYALDEAQQSWSGGTPAEVRQTGPDTQEGTAVEDDEPKFVIDRGENDKRDSPSLYRDALRLDLGIKTFAVNSLSSETLNTWSSADEFFYASLRADFRYWLPFLGRSFGFNFRSNGYSWAPGDPDILFNALDLGVNLRGFLLENKSSRLELGIDFGGSMLTDKSTQDGLERNWAMYLGLWGADPVFYHLFKVESLERLVFSGGIRIYSSNSQEILETVNYRMDTGWYLDRWFGGIRLEWWDFSEDAGSVNMLSFSLFGGLHY